METKKLAVDPSMQEEVVKFVGERVCSRCHLILPYAAFARIKPPICRSCQANLGRRQRKKRAA